MCSLNKATASYSFAGLIGVTGGALLLFGGLALLSRYVKALPFSSSLKSTKVVASLMSSGATLGVSGVAIAVFSAYQGRKKIQDASFHSSEEDTVIVRPVEDLQSYPFLKRVLEAKDSQVDFLGGKNGFDAAVEELAGCQDPTSQFAWACQLLCWIPPWDAWENCHHATSYLQKLTSLIMKGMNKQNQHLYQTDAFQAACYNVALGLLKETKDDREGTAIIILLDDELAHRDDNDRLRKDYDDKFYLPLKHPQMATKFDIGAYDRNTQIETTSYSFSAKDAPLLKGVLPWTRSGNQELRPDNVINGLEQRFSANSKRHLWRLVVELRFLMYVSRCKLYGAPSPQLEVTCTYDPPSDQFTINLMMSNILADRSF